uniref:Torsin family 2 member A n=1 Tax=Gouania willdenowi TaxID=441366 RepID=A0A8C5G4S0_GOUWI
MHCGYCSPLWLNAWYLLSLHTECKTPNVAVVRGSLSANNMITFLFVLILFVASPVMCVFQRLYCSIADNCDCDFKANIRDLEWDLFKNVFGQHLAQEVVSEEVSRFLQNKSPDRPLVLSFHGSSGTGKTLISSMVANHLYGSAMSSPYIHQFIPTLHFPSAQHVPHYRELKKWVQGNLTQCARSVFIFDEMEKMPLGLIDVLEPLLGPSYVVFSTNYRKAIYIFISTTGEEVINKVTLENRQSGGEREDINLLELEDGISTLWNIFTFTHVSGITLVSIKKLKYIIRIRCHVARCTHLQLLQRGVFNRRDVVDAVAAEMIYSPVQGRFFSTTGCKAVPAKINLHL